MICPLTGTVRFEGDIFGMKCIEKDCAWYDKDKGQCNEVSKRQALEAIAKALNSTLKIDGKVHTHPF